MLVNEWFVSANDIIHSGSSKAPTRTHHSLSQVLCKSINVHFITSFKSIAFIKKGSCSCTNGIPSCHSNFLYHFSSNISSLVARLGINPFCMKYSYKHDVDTYIRCSYTPALSILTVTHEQMKHSMHDTSTSASRPRRTTKSTYLLFTRHDPNRYRCVHTSCEYVSSYRVTNVFDILTIMHRQSPPRLTHVHTVLMCIYCVL